MTEWDKIKDMALIPIKYTLNRSFEKHSDEYEEWQFSRLYFKIFFDAFMKITKGMRVNL